LVHTFPDQTVARQEPIFYSLWRNPLTLWHYTWISLFECSYPMVERELPCPYCKRLNMITKRKWTTCWSISRKQTIPG
jgi:hypothetical protein